MTRGAHYHANIHTVPKTLVINADDFGWSPSVNNAIADGIRNGVITSASMMANAPGFEHGLALFKRLKEDPHCPDFSVGVHLNIYRFWPLLSADRVQSLIDKEGKFLENGKRFGARFLTGRIRLSEVEEEFRAQIMRVRDAGFAISHLDSEHHLHLIPSLFPIVARLARAYGITTVRVIRERHHAWRSAKALLLNFCSFVSLARTKTPVTIVAQTIGISAAPTTLEAFQRLLGHLSFFPAEFIVHPIYAKDDFFESSVRTKKRAALQRASELKTLTDPTAQTFVKKANIRLENFFTIRHDTKTLHRHPAL